MRLAVALLLCIALVAAASQPQMRPNNATMAGIASAGCQFGIDRKITSDRWLTTVATTLTDEGCQLANATFEDQVPPEFGSIYQMAFFPRVNSSSNRTLRFVFASFGAGEAKTLIYSAPLQVPDFSRADFTPGLVYYRIGNGPQQKAIPAAAGQQARGQGAYDAALTLSAVGTFIILAAGIGLIYYLEKKKREKAG